MSSYYDCPECGGDKTMVAEKSADIYNCSVCGFHAGCAFLTGYWRGWERAQNTKVDMKLSELTKKRSKELKSINITLNMSESSFKDLADQKEELVNKLLEGVLSIQVIGIVHLIDFIQDQTLE